MRARGATARRRRKLCGTSARRPPADLAGPPIPSPVGWSRAGLGLICAVFVAISVTYSDAIPAYEGPDEVWHVMFARDLAHGVYPEQPIGDDRRDFFAHHEAAQPPLYYLMVAPFFRGLSTDDVVRTVLPNPHGSLGGPGVVDNRNLFIHPPGGGAAWPRLRLARYSSTAIGVAIVALTYLIGRRMWPARPEAATLAAAGVAFLPGFVFISSLVTNDNGVDLWSAVLLGLIAADASAVLVGLALGAAALSKTSGLVAAPVVAIALRSPRRVAGAAGLAVAVAGWWYARNVVLYGELTGLARHLNRTNLYDEVPTAREVVDDVPGLYQSFVGMFGWFSIPMADTTYLAFGILFALGLLGLPIGASRTQEGPRHLLWLLVLWCVLVLAALVASRLMFRSFHGRLLYPALPAVAVLWAGGLLALAPRRFGVATAIGTAAVLAVHAALVPALYLRPAYAAPDPGVCASATSSAGVAGAPIALAGSTLAADELHPGGDLDVTLCWRASQTSGRSLSVFVQMVDPLDGVLAKHDGLPGRGNDATLWWTPASLHADPHRLRVPHGVDAPVVARIVAGFYDSATGARLAGVGPSGTDTVEVGSVRVVSAAPRASASPVARFDDGTELLAMKLDPGALAGLLELGTSRPLIRSHTMSVQLVGSGGLIAQQDGLPRGGLFPTTSWRQGDVVPHRFELRPPAPPADGPYALLLVVYDQPEGTRIRSGPDDHVVLARLCALGGRLAPC